MTNNPLEPNFETRYVGLDVHREVLQACILDAQGRLLERHRFDLTRPNLEAFIRERLRPQDRVALEATTNTWAVVDALQPHVAEVVVGNPLHTRAIAEAKVKTDKVDAEVLAQLLRCDYLPRVWQPDAATRRLRELTAYRAGLVADQTRLEKPRPQPAGPTLDPGAGGRALQRPGPGVAEPTGLERQRSADAGGSPAPHRPIGSRFGQR